MQASRSHVIVVLSIALSAMTVGSMPGTAAASGKANRGGRHGTKCAKASASRHSTAARSASKRSRSRRACPQIAPLPTATPALPAPLPTPNPAISRLPGSVAVTPPAEESTRAPEEAAAEPPAEKLSGPPFRFFSPTSIWNQPLAANAELDPSSAALAATFDAEVMHGYATGTAPWIDTTSYSVPVYTVPAGQPTVPVRLVSSAPAPALQAAWDAVPLPATALPAAGTDAALVVWQPSSDRLWEFWRLGHSQSGWQAAWGGAMQSVSSNPGVYDSSAWTGSKPWWGSSASSLSIAGGLITFEDLEHGSIEHALAIALPNVRAGVFASPAQRSDGTSVSPLSLPEGAHLRLDPNLDLASLHLPPLTLMIAQAAQRYGIFVRDRARVAHFFAQDPISTGTEPYGGKTGFFEGRTPAQLLASFPWSHLQVLRMELHPST